MKYNVLNPIDTDSRTVRVRYKGGNIPLLVISPKEKKENATAVLWIHGGGYMSGFKKMAYMSRAGDLVKYYGAVVFSPGYRLSWMKPYPAAIEDCYAALKYIKDNAKKYGINPNQIMIGGESAGGGLCAALAIMARDRGEVGVCYQMPLYPMIDNLDTESSRDNHGRKWNTRLNHFGWRLYLRGDAKKEVSPYAAPARLDDMSSLPPCYTYVGTGEPFYSETLDYIKRMKEAGIEAEVDIYDTDMHSFDLFMPDSDIGKEAIRKFREHFEYAQAHYFSENRV